MIILGVILILLGALLAIPLLATAGIILVIVGAVAVFAPPPYRGYGRYPFR